MFPRCASGDAITRAAEPMTERRHPSSPQPEEGMLRRGVVWKTGCGMYDGVCKTGCGM